MSENSNKIYETLSKAGTPAEQLGNALLINGDSLKILRRMPSDSIDSCVIDGPYGIGFMGKEWDNFKPKAVTQATGNYRKGQNHNTQTGRSPSMFSGLYDLSRRGAVNFQQFTYEWSKEVYRVLKPGAMLLSFCSPRLYHRMATGIEDAGFEIRDQIQYIYGSGFPKSHNISKSIDKLYNAEREIVGENPNRKGRNNWDNNPKDITLPATDKAKQWDGWQTGLKPSNEPIVLARKPIAEKTVARNVLKYGTGGINIDACRIGVKGGTKATVTSNRNTEESIDSETTKAVDIVPINKGRFPSNTIIDEEVAEMLGDKAKFFYAPKVSKKERNAGCDHLEARQQNCTGKQRTYNDYCAVCGKRFIGSPNNICLCPPGIKKTDKTAYKNKNHHPTVKNVSLMEYLVKLVTPKSGICLDIFMGSGSTGVACANLGFNFIGIEREPEYFEIAKARISHWQNVKKVA